MQSQAPPAPSESRFFRGGNVIYKFEIRRNSSKIRQDPFLALSFLLVHWWQTTGAMGTNVQTAKPKQRKEGSLQHPCMIPCHSSPFLPRFQLLKALTNCLSVQNAAAKTVVLQARGETEFSSILRPFSSTFLCYVLVKLNILHQPRFLALISSLQSSMLPLIL